MSRFPGLLVYWFTNISRSIAFHWTIFKQEAILTWRTLRITDRKKQSEARAALFAVRVNAIVMFIFGLASLLTLTPQVNRQYQEKGKPLQSTVPPP